MSGAELQFGSYTLSEWMFKYKDFLKCHEAQREAAIHVLRSRDTIHSNTDDVPSPFSDHHVVLLLENGAPLYHFKPGIHPNENFFTLSDLRTEDFEEHVSVTINGCRISDATYRIQRLHRGTEQFIAGPYGFTRWSEELLHAQILSLLIKIEKSDAVDMGTGYGGQWLWQVGQLIFSLSSFLEWGAHSLQTLNLTIDLTGTPNMQTHETELDSETGMPFLQNILWQLRRIGRIDNIVIAGLAPENERYVRMLMSNGPNNRHGYLSGPFAGWTHPVIPHDPSNSAMVKGAIAASKYPYRLNLMERCLWLLDEVHAYEAILPILGIRQSVFDLADLDMLILDDDVAKAAAHIWGIFDGKNIIEPYWEHHLNMLVQELQQSLNDFYFRASGIAVANFDGVTNTPEWATYMERCGARTQAFSKLDQKEATVQARPFG